MEILIKDIAQYAGETVTIKGWIYNRRNSGKKLAFLQLRDGSGTIQGVAHVNEMPEEEFQSAAAVTTESSAIIIGVVKEDKRAPSGFELTVTNFELVGEGSNDYPIQPKEHGVDFLLDRRHLWFRTERQRAILRLRDRTIFYLRDFFNKDGFTCIDSPIITGSACEGTSTLFELDYFGRPAYLSQSGQLYVEPACMALGSVYCFGPTFRAEKSFTRRHLTEFWMLEPEVAWQTQDGNIDLQSRMIKSVVGRILENDSELIEQIHARQGEDSGEETAAEVISRLEKARDEKFVRLTYDEALKELERLGEPLTWGDDFGAPHETKLTEEYGVPVFVEKWPAKIKAFYMQPYPDDDTYVQCDDLIASGGYGEIIGGSIRIHDSELLLKRIDEHKLDRRAFQWYLDIREYGTVPHGGFGLGLERLVQWLGGVHHIRETIPFPRTIKRLEP